MENKKSLLNASSINIAPKITLRIPTVGEILENESSYYCLTSTLTSSAFTFMVQLDDMGLDYTKTSDWELFRILFLNYTHQVMFYKSKILALHDTMSHYRKKSPEYAECIQQEEFLNNAIDDIGFDVVFDNLVIAEEINGRVIGFEEYEDESKNIVLFNAATGAQIDECTYNDIVNSIRNINLYKKVPYTAANENAREYLLKKERRKLKRSKNRKYTPYLENMVVSLVNTSEFPYDYDSCMDLSIYRFNRSLHQIQHKIAFDNTMIGIYSGTVDAKKINDKDSLSWVQTQLKL